jgi:hypothetical protein
MPSQPLPGSLSSPGGGGELGGGELGGGDGWSGWLGVPGDEGGGRSAPELPIMSSPSSSSNCTGTRLGCSELLDALEVAAVGPFDDVRAMPGNTC